MILYQKKMIFPMSVLIDGRRYATRRYSTRRNAMLILLDTTVLDTNAI
jgi:hypothetical protein